jgi:pimeloyl-ACP methyl ester carboxylesterase
MLIPHFKGNLEERMRLLGCILHGHSGIRLVGSSLGGLMAAIFAMENPSRVERLILLAPAINAPSFTPYLKQTLTVPVWIYHGLQDDIIPLHEVERIARAVFNHVRFHLMDDNHSLRKTFTAIDWQRLL